MAIYDAITRQPIESPDLETGYLVEGTIITGYTTEVFSDTITAARPNGIKHRVPVYEDCQWYFPDPEEPEKQPDIGSFEDRMSAVEKEVEEAKEGLAAAKILLGVE